MNYFTEEQLNRISHLVGEIEKLSDVEKLFLYLQLPCGRAAGAEGKSKPLNGSKPSSDLFTKKPDQETTQTYTWIISHLEVDPNVSLPKQEVYDEYRAFCQANRFEPLCVADFGKAMKHAFPYIKPRRLGQRGNSRYCYSGLRKKYKIHPPNLPDMIEPTFCLDNDCSQAYNQIIKDCRDNPDECPLSARTNFTGYEGAMNLKVHASQQQQQQQHSHPQPNGNGNGTAAGYNGADHAARQVNVQQPPGQSHHDSPASAPPDYVPSNPIAINQHRYNYAGIIKQPGTPDDDDYCHNYQDMLPIKGHLFAASAAFPTMSTSTSEQQQQPSQVPTAALVTSGFVYHPHPTNQHLHHQQQQQPQAQHSTGKQTPSHNQLGTNHRIDERLGGMAISSAGPTGSIGGQQEGEQRQQQQQQQPQQASFVAGLSPGQNAGGSTQQQQPPLQQHPSSTDLGYNIHLSHMMNNSSHIDCSASPFQSPASTPYPMGHYLSQDIQNYYSNDCRYPES